MFELSEVSVSRGGSRVLIDVSMTLPEGSSCIVGPSGSGKSTLLRLLNRLADPDSGIISYRGEDIRARDVLELRREVGLVPQIPVPIDDTVEGNLRWAAAFADLEPDIDRLLELAGLDSSFASRQARKLSVGEQQRVMLARALAPAPKVLLLDEPTSALDSGARDAVESALGSVRAALDLSVVIVTHDLEQAARLADRVVRIESGRVSAQGSAAEVLSA